jgi:acyl carrier protein
VNTPDTLETIASIIARQFEFTGPITATTVAKDVDGWDSVAHVELVLSIEDHFGIRLTTGETVNIPNVGAFAAVVDRHLQRKRG